MATYPSKALENTESKGIIELLEESNMDLHRLKKNLDAYTMNEDDLRYNIFKMISQMFYYINDLICDINDIHME